MQKGLNGLFTNLPIECGQFIGEYREKRLKGKKEIDKDMLFVHLYIQWKNLRIHEQFLRFQIQRATYDTLGQSISRSAS